jgi:hypothetical protein
MDLYPPPGPPTCTQTCAIPIKQKLMEKRRLRIKWQTTRSPQDKTAFNRVTKNIKQLLYEVKQQGVQTYLTNLTATEATDYSLWKATRELKRPPTPISPLRTAGDELAKRDVQKTVVFVDLFQSVFCPYPP